MKRIVFVMMLAVLFGATSCEKTAPTADVNIQFDNMANSKALVLDDALSYTTPMGQSYSVSMLKYYIGNVVLVDAAGTEVKLDGYHLINEGTPGQKLKITMPAVANGNYTKLKFSLGVSPKMNAAAQIGGDLDVSNGMYWEMVGYTFLKHEGRYKKADGTTDVFVIHYGRDYGYIDNIEIPLSTAEVEGVARTIRVKFDLDKVYGNGYDMHVDNFHMSTSDTEIPWIYKFRTNLSEAFSLRSIE
ncbi:MAG: hypothetical protein RL660_72 [Bacteroidota bacterium]|jgi:hypothetical protein